MTAYNFVQLDPRPTAVNPEFGFGVEVTMKMPAGLVNLDHHHPGDTAKTPAACDQAMKCKLPVAGTVIATVRPDQDSATAMAILESRANGRKINPGIVKAVSKFDRFGPACEAKLRYRKTVIAIALVASDHKKSMLERVEFIQACLDGTADKAEIKHLAQSRYADLASAEKTSKIVEVIPGKLVYVETTSRHITLIGYKRATTVIGFNPAMPGEGGPYKKYTVCRYDSNVATDLPAALAELQALEEKWGGRGDIFGSPMGQDSKLTAGQVIEVVKKYVK